MKILKNKYFIICMSFALAAVLVTFGSLGTVLAVTKGEKIDHDAAATEYNSAIPDVSHLYGLKSKQLVSAMLNELDGHLKNMLASANIEAILYTDATVTAVGKILGHSTSKELSSVDFTYLEKTYPTAYAYILSEQNTGKTWDDIGTVPFGVTAGDKDSFIKACGAIGGFVGDDMINIFLEAPDIYNDALVPVMESLHIGKMPSIISFALKTGLSGSARIELMAEKMLSVVEPFKASPLTYLLDILPDFIINYNKACEFISSKNLGLSLPSIDSILTAVFNALKFTFEPVDLEYISRLGVASIDESGRNGGKRVKITGDRESIFLYLADYITGLFTYENNFSSVENILVNELKNTDSSQPIMHLMKSDTANAMIGCLMDIISSTTPKSVSTDITSEIGKHNSTPTDESTVFSGIMTRENTASIIDSLDARIISYLTENDITIENVIYTDASATAVTRLTAMLTGKELSEIPFAALKDSFPEAYEYVTSLKNEGKTWEDIGTIPFGVAQGDKSAFIKACGAGAEHFGDTLALCLMVCPTSYEEALIPLLEALHTGPMPNLKDFVSSQGLDGAKRMQVITEKILTIIEPLKAAPVSYLCRMLPDLVNSYNSASAFSAQSPDMALTGLALPDINTLLSEILGGLSIKVPEYDFNEIVRLSVAAAAISGDRSGQRMELTGDREAVFLAMASYIIQLADYENNMSAITSVASRILGIDTQFIDSIITALKGVSITNKKQSTI